MSASLPAGVSHLLIADDALIPSRWGPHITLCGLEVRRPNIEYDDPALDCPYFRYCPECVTEATRWSAATGQAAGCPVSELAAVTDADGMCPACQSGAAIRQASCTPLVEAFSCNQCDTRWAISNPPSLVDRIASAIAARSIPDEVITVAPDSRAQAVRDDDNQPRGYFVGACGHRVPLVGPICYVGPCEECGGGR